LSNQTLELLDLTSFSQLVQELIGGAVRRHTFAPRELELLLDLQSCSIRKSARPDLLRRYLKAVQQKFALDRSEPLRLSHFVEGEQRRRRSCRRPLPNRLVAAHGAA